MIHPCNFRFCESRGPRSNEGKLPPGEIVRVSVNLKAIARLLWAPCASRLAGTHKNITLLAGKLTLLLMKGQQ